MKRKFLAGLLVMASLASIVGCGSVNAGDMNNSRNEQNGDRNSSGENTNQGNNSGTASYEYEQRNMSASNIVNSVIVTDMIAEANNGQNIMYSPTSLNMALALVGEGASGSSANLINSFLGTESYRDRATELLNGFENYNNGNAANGYSCKLEIANALWVDKSIKLLSDYEKTAKNIYAAKADEIDFGKPEKACKKINNWAKDNTHGLIDQIIDESMISPNTKLCITNSLYFEAPWSEEWYIDYADTEFTLFDGSKQEIEYIANAGGAYFENDFATAFSCTYMNGLEFIGILPDNEGDFTLEELDIEGLLRSRNYDHDELYYKMPRLDFETKADLKDVFIAMGMGALFNGGEAEINGIANTDLFISNIIQKTKLELDEYGTKAAAVTAISMDENCAMPVAGPVVKRVNLTRPFAFLIYDSADDEILFMGKVVTAK